ncbi:hypothetical protein [Haloquadratum walsbyi]|jgi:hypothetical protein|uniref:Uncharacterized protein n=1 Tax=Haloquadratum walsbyi J07HQW2 TaxID=1238425 RepID=U1PJW2_9EURY|nr:hypothetical protein [Haloquadratum walsbyi]ERG93952.1 MAG: hypothetical protein J07HQW2_00386 [Haloquadratum walsbyi J07HQW2]
MSDICTKLQSRLLSTDFEAWNNPKRVKLLLPMFVIIGGGLGVLIQSYGALNRTPLPVLWTIFVLLGVTLLAIVD